MTCMRRRTTFEILRDNNGKIGMNTTAYKFYCPSVKISFLVLNLGFTVNWQAVPRVSCQEPHNLMAKISIVIGKMFKESVVFYY